jgi:hypothetical protein
MMHRVWAAALTALAVVGVFMVLAVSQQRAPVIQVIVPRTAGSGASSGLPSVSGPAPVASSGIPTTRSS